jgi:hypothetical protein
LEFSLVESQLGLEASIAGAVTLGGIQNFPEELPCQCLCEEWNEQMEKFSCNLHDGRLLQLF